ncbi:MAG TPA: M14 family zinc carboxypeptidase [Solirubrobacterales bacterium]|nr:M14 family zinc carboxypeptidase [Solirubrobacterales bacterium]
MRAALAVVVLAVALTGAAPGAGGGDAGVRSPTERDVVLLGHSVRGRAVKAVRIGDRDARREVLVVGAIHGDERAGVRVIRRLRRRWADLRGVDLWTVRTVNPDGVARGMRPNVRGVDLNRNFSHDWSGADPNWSGYYAGPFPFSEPESKLVRRLILRLRPTLTIWFHQPWGQVLAPCRGDARLERRYSLLSGIPLRRCRGEGLSGTATKWQEHRFPASTAFVVELPAGRPGRATVRRNARAVAVLARDGLRRRTKRVRSTVTSMVRANVDLARIRPKIVRWPIPYGPRRKRDMAAYSKRHYGQFEWRLRRVEQVVQHFAVTDSARAVYNTFAPNRPDVEYRELPGVCSHFVINDAGRIFQLVGLRTRCRHVVGLNHLSVGIEHTGHSDAEVLGTRRQLRASLRLSRWLRCRFDLGVKRVIGHNESLSSPFYREFDPRFKGRTHGDFRPATMHRYRRKLRRLGPCP